MDKKKAKLSAALPAVVVVGDWVVDEHWVTGIERSATASRRGASHSHGLHTLQSTVDALSGAGLTASILAQAKSTRGGENLPICKVHGVGIWNPGDQDVLRAMMVPKNTSGRSPYRIKWPIKFKDLANIKLHNLATLLPHLADRCGTTTVIRIYKRTANDEIQLLSRIDWELRPAGDEVASPNWIATDEDLKTLLQATSGRQTSFPKEPAAIVIKDLVKGVVTDQTIEWLLKLYGNKSIPWFISSKSFRPKWLNKLHNERVRLLVIPPVAAHEATRNAEGISGWCVAQGMPSPEALALIESQYEELHKLAPNFKNKLIVALPIAERTCIIAKSCGNDAPELLAKRDDKSLAPRVGVPMASVLFGAMIGLAVNRPDIKDKQLLESALHFTNDWMSHQSKRIENPESWSPMNEPTLEVNDQTESSKTSDVFKIELWSEAHKKWNQAHSFESRGIIQYERGNHVEKRIELWRSMIDVDRYVALTTFKRNAIRKLGMLLERFKDSNDSNERRPMSTMLLAKPGSGKSCLISKLASQHGLQFLSFNVAQMVRKEDLFDAFDAVVSSQAQLQTGQQTLVFFDEINVEIENSPVYTAFLDPIDCGVYRRAGKAFHIRRCVWVFAGTGIDELKPETKGPDFLSRLTLQPIQFDSDPKDVSDDAKLERIYLGVSMLKEEFPEARYVSRKVIDAFAHLNPELSFREQAKFVHSFENVRDCIVLASNIPAHALKGRMVNSDVGHWGSLSENPRTDKVEIVREP